MELDPLGGQVVHAQHRAAPLLAELHDRPRVVRGREHGGPHRRLENLLDLPLGELRRVRHDDLLAALGRHPVNNRRRRGDDVDPEFALHALPDDLQMQQPQEPASEAEAEGHRVLWLV